MRFGILLLLALGTAGACAGSRKASPQTDRTIIAESEIRGAAQGTTVSQLLARLRPDWLRGRGRTTIRGPALTPIVYVNNQRTAGTGMLHTLTTEQVREIRFLDAITATQRFGTDHGAGAILITLR